MGALFFVLAMVVLFWVFLLSRVPERVAPITSLVVRKEYRIHGRDEYVVEAIPQPDGTYHLYSRLNPPPVNSLGVDHHHLGNDSKICVAREHAPRTAEAAVQIGRCWAEGWSEYLRTGLYPAS